ESLRAMADAGRSATRWRNRSGTEEIASAGGAGAGTVSRDSPSAFRCSPSRLVTRSTVRRYIDVTRLQCFAGRQPRDELPNSTCTQQLDAPLNAKVAE